MKNKELREFESIINSNPYYPVILNILSNEELSIYELQKELDLTYKSTLGIVKRLEREGIIEIKKPKKRGLKSSLKINGIHKEEIEKILSDYNFALEDFNNLMERKGNKELAMRILGYVDRHKPVTDYKIKHSLLSQIKQEDIADLILVLSRLDKLGFIKKRYETTKLGKKVLKKNAPIRQKFFKIAEK